MKSFIVLAFFAIIAVAAAQYGGYGIGRGIGGGYGGLGYGGLGKFFKVFH